MNTWIEHLSSPLVLVGFMIFIFAGLIKFLLKNNIIKFNQVNSAKLINKSLNFIFILAFLGMASGFFSEKENLSANDEKNKMEDNSNSINKVDNSGSINQGLNESGYKTKNTINETKNTGTINQGVNTNSNAENNSYKKGK